MIESSSTFIKISDEDRSHFEEIGLARLKQLAAMPGSPYPDMPAVMGWIAEQEQQIAADQAALMRSTRDAAWDAVHNSQKASTLAKWALGVAALAALAAFLSAWLQYQHV